MFTLNNKIWRVLSFIPDQLYLRDYNRGYGLEHFEILQTHLQFPY